MNILKLIFSTTFILITALYTYGQDKKIYISAEDSSYYTSRYGKEKDMHLPKFLSVKEGRSWRFWYDKYIAASFIIDVIGQDSMNCQAFITLYTYGDVIQNEQDMFGKVYYEQVTLDTDIARGLYKAAALVNVGRFARKDTVENLVRGYMVTDGSPYTVEYSNEKAYYFKAGLLPENETQFKAFINTADKYMNFEELKDKFEKNIPFGYYSSGKWMTIHPKRSSKQIRQYKKYWKNRTE
ncbi:MAG: hypothetical protein H7Y07_05690 [Pyrinomonadaceae bacterium]|nr:hypothetical protein [Sphingobacteriaceae bacterium]